MIFFSIKTQNYKQQIMSIRKNINYGLCGSVSVGKSTILNSLLWEYLGETKLKRTTYVPFKFINKNGINHDVKSIHDNIININQNNNNEIKIKEFEMDFKWNSDSLYNCSIIDFPGLNDPHEDNNKMENLLIDNLIKLDYLIYIIDSNNSLNNKSERNFLCELFEKVKNCDTMTNLIFVFNKYDEEDEEIDELIDDVKKFIVKLSNDWKINIPKMYKISGRKLMIKNVLLKVDDQNIIPKSIRKKVYGEYFGKIIGDQMLNYPLNQLKQKIEEIPFTEDEYKFMNNYYSSFDNKTFYDNILSHMRNKIDEEKNIHVNDDFSSYFLSTSYFISLNNSLDDKDKKSIIADIIDYYFNNNKTQFVENINFTKNILNFIDEIVSNNSFLSENNNDFLFSYCKKVIDKLFDLKNPLNCNLFSIFEFLNKHVCEKTIKYFSEKMFSFVNDDEHEYKFMKSVNIFRYCQDGSVKMTRIVNKIMQFFVNNFELLSEDNNLVILGNVFLFKVITFSSSREYDFSLFKSLHIIHEYMYKIYIDSVYYLITNEKYSHEDLSIIKYEFTKQNIELSYDMIIKSDISKLMYKLDSFLSNKMYIFGNFKEEYGNSYPIEIITLYNYYTK